MKNTTECFTRLQIPGHNIFAWVVLCIVIFFVSIYSHLIAHILIGGYSLFLVYLFFVYSSKIYKFQGQNFIVGLANALLIIALLDVFHILTFKGMTLIDFYGSNVAAQFWVAARILETVAFLFCSVFSRRNMNSHIVRLIFGSTVLLVILSIIVFGNFPICYVENYGAAPFKKWGHIFVIAVLTGSIYLLIKKKNEFGNLLQGSFAAYILASIAGELVMAFFDENIFFASMGGHFLKALSYYFLCHGVYLAGIRMPVEKYIESEGLVKFERGKTLKLFNQINYGLCSIDQRTGLMKLTGKWFNLFGYKGDESVDFIESWEKIIHPDDRYFLDYIRNGENDLIDYEFRMKNSSGGYEWISLKGIETESGFTGKGREIFSIISLISESKNSELELLEQKRKIEESDRLKSAFIDNLGHEIRTPLDSILGFARMLREKRADPGKSELYLDIIESSSRQILSVVSDLIDIARIDEGQFQLNYDQIELNNFLDEMEELYIIRLKAANKSHIGFHVLKGSGVPFEIISDRPRLKQIIYNLLNNALKFTQTGNITLSYEICSNSVEFRVIDTGIGIDKDKKAIIFERFRQGNEGISRVYGGIGLGLPIAREFVLLLGGTMGVESEPGMGAEFYFSIPLNIESGHAL